MSADPDISGDKRDGQANVDDWRGLGEMITLTTERLAAPIEGVHMAVLDRWFGLAGPTFEPARRLVGELTASVYTTIRIGGSVIGSTISMTSELVGGRRTLRPLWETRRGRYVQSIFNGVLGDRLEEDEKVVRIRLGLRDRDGRPIPTTQTSLRRAFPKPSGRLVLLLHGLGETERCWQSEQDWTLAAQLEVDGFSVLQMRYNTGRAVEHNGAAVADLLENIVSDWPVPVEECALIGHSMGGLVAGSALRAARSSGYRWADLTTHLVSIGTPHLGSPIEKGVEVISKSLGLFKETRPLAAFLEGRSRGIKDLGHGLDHRLDGVEYHAVAGAVTSEPSHPLGVLAGDLVVRVDSALGSGRHDRSASDVLVVGGRNHADLRHDPEVAAQIRRWLTPAPR